MTTLYKKDSKGKIRFWTISTEGADIVQKSGVLHTDSPVEHRKTATPKNVGRSNETSPEEQAVLEMESAIKKKLDKAYFRDIDSARNEVVIMPMKARKYEDIAKKINWDDEAVPVHVQPKLDGIRCLAFIDGDSIKLMTRGGKEITTLDHIKVALDKIKGSIVLDGEVYAHGLSFQENTKLIKKYRKGQTEQIRYHVYDVVSKADYSFRYNYIERLIKHLDAAHIELIEDIIVTSEEEMKAHHTGFIANGYEGTMIRHGSAGYQSDKRSPFLLKYKQFLDVALKVKDVIPGEANPEQGYFIFDWEDAKGHPLGDDILGCGMSFSHEEREEFLDNKDDYIGKVAEVRFFEYSEEGIPRFPVCVGLKL